MPGPKAVTGRLTATERADLEQITRRHHVSQQVAQRARIVLAAGAGKSNSQIRRELNISREMVRHGRQSWIDLQPLPGADLSVEDRLAALPRPSAPARISPDQVCQIQQLACEKPAESGRPISHWTNREVAEEVKQRGIVADISPRHAARLLKKGLCSRTWFAMG